MTAYLDNSATTKVCDEAAKAVFDMMTENFGNPSSTHTMGRNAQKKLEDARKNVATALGCGNDEIFFTSGGTEADNWALFSSAEFMRHRGKHIITTCVEHDAVLKSAKKLEKYGFDVTYINAGPDGRVCLDELKAALREDTILVSMMLINNETGAVNDVSCIAGEIKARGLQALLHTDAVQAFCKIPFTPKSLGADLISLSSHKIHGPKGSGALFMRRGLRLPPFISGGGQEKGFRSGTEALPNIVGFGEAARIGKDLLPETGAHMRELRTYTMNRILELIPFAVIIGSGDAPHILNISLPGYKSQVLMNYLESQGVFVSNSSACNRGGRSHVLSAMGLDNEIIDGALRISFSRMNTIEEAEYFASTLKAATLRLIRTKRR